MEANLDGIRNKKRSASRMKRSPIIALVCVLALLILAAVIAELKVRQEYKNRLRHIHEVARVLESLRQENDMYPSRIDDPYVRGILDGVINVFDGNLGYETTGESFKLFEKEPRGVHLFVKDRIILGNSE
jgi:hypothetical protein